MKKTINIVCSYASIYGGNFIPSLLYLSNKIRENGNIVIFTFPNDAKDREWVKHIQSQGYNVFFIDFNNAFSKKIKSINKNNRVNVLYSHFLSGLKIKILYPFSKKIKLLIHVHSDFSAGKKNGLITKIKRLIEYKILRRDATYFYVSGEMSLRHGNRKKHIYLPNALCLDRIPCKQINIKEFKEAHHIGNNDTVYLHFGWSPYVKGTDIAVKSFVNSNYNDTNSKLIVVHGRDDGYNKCLSYLESKGINLKELNGKIIFIPPTEDIFSLYEIADIFISSSRSEGFSYSILESLYFNLKVYSSDIPGVRWSRKYDVQFFKNADELTQMINDSVDFKKENIVNKKIVDEFDINMWCSSIFNVIKESW